MANVKYITEYSNAVKLQQSVELGRRTRRVNDKNTLESVRKSRKKEIINAQNPTFADSILALAGVVGTAIVGIIFFILFFNIISIILTPIIESGLHQKSFVIPTDLFVDLLAALSAIGVIQWIYRLIKRGWSSPSPSPSPSYSAPDSLTSEEEIIKSGLDGELVALQTAKQLPDEYTLFNEVYLPSRTSRTGFNEADFIISGPDCLFVIEVKNNTGTIEGSDKDPEWKALKLDRYGVEHPKAMRNPIKQVNNVSWLLSDYLNSNNLKVWVQPLVLFTNKAVRFNLLTTDVPVLTTDDLVVYILSYQHERCYTVADKVSSVIGALKAKNLQDIKRYESEHRLQMNAIS